jgi:hypothetical protein
LRTMLLALITYLAKKTLLDWTKPQTHRRVVSEVWRLVRATKSSAPKS